MKNETEKEFIYFAFMFTGIVEFTGMVKQVIANGGNRTFWITSDLAPSLKVDQSVSHNGVCLTIEAIKDKSYQVTAVAETLNRSSLSVWKEGSIINLERCLELGSRLDGHIVQGHVDCTGICKKIKERDGSWEFSFAFPGKFAGLIIEKGSISINGISLTVFNVKKKSFSVAIVPYTYNHTNIKELKKGDQVNLEFDIIGKYLIRQLELK